MAAGKEPARSETSTLLNSGGEYLALWFVRQARRRGLFLRSRGCRAALAGQAFMHVVTYVMVIGVVGLVLLMPLAGELGKRSTSLAAQAAG